MGLSQGVTLALTSSKESELQTVAALFAQGKIEELRAEMQVAPFRSRTPELLNF